MTDRSKSPRKFTSKEIIRKIALLSEISIRGKSKRRKRMMVIN